MDTIMLSLIWIAVLVAFFDSFNEQILAAIYLLSTKKPVQQLSIMIVTIFIVNVLVGLAIVHGLGKIIADFFKEPYLVDYFIEVALGILLLVFAFIMKFKPTPQKVIAKSKPGLYPGLILGVTFAVINIPTAFPYYAVIAKIISVKMSFFASLFILILYNLVSALPKLTILFLYIRKRERFAAMLESKRELIRKITFYLIKIVFFVLGVLMIIDVLFYAFSGAPLI